MLKECNALNVSNVLEKTNIFFVESSHEYDKL